MSSRAPVRARILAGIAVVIASLPVHAAGPAWQPLPSLADVRQQGARDVAAVVAAQGSVQVPLPFTVATAGGLARNLDIGTGWIALDVQAAPTASLDGSVRAGGGDRSMPTRVDVIAGEAVSIGALSRILYTSAPDGVAVRFVALETPWGAATAEALVDREGRVAVQFLHVPSAAGGSGGVRAGLDDARLAPVSATAYRVQLTEPVRLDPPRATAMPKRTDPPPANCTAETGTWCDRADGPGTSQVYLSEGFDDLAAASRGWTFTGDWHANPYNNCPPGAMSNPGAATYFGADGSCAYQPDVFGSLVSPAFGPVTAGSQFTWSSRLQYEGGGFDLAQIYVNGTLIGDMPTGLDPTLWYNFNPIDLSPWAGQMVQIEFYFQSDGAFQLTGWFVDDVIAWNPSVGNPDCLKNAGHSPYAPCSQRQSTQWDFNETGFCKGCQYTFYVLVECGREMHLPLEDMEGADVTVTNVVDPLASVPLRCVNQTSRADAGLGAYRGLNFIDYELGVYSDCCPAGPDGTPEVWWGPAMDATDSAGPGRVAWGLSDGCPSWLVYDLDPPDPVTGAISGVQCDEIPPCTSGLATRMSPGEEQVMDCYINDDTGLCGLYRVDVVSGGNVWRLFANCDGTNTPQFPIFFDCTEAWSAYNPLPELTVTNLVVTNGCPNLQVDFDLINVGCADQGGDVTVRISASGADASCGLPPDVLDTPVSGPGGVFPPGVPVHVTRNITAPCSPARVDVTADPLDAIAECTETPGAAACRRDVGINTLTSFTCGCAAQLIADAGADESGCFLDPVRLTGAASTISPCANPQYQWKDGAGNVVQSWRSSPVYDVLVRCPAGQTYTLEVQCAGESCTDSDTVTVSCIDITADAGQPQAACVGTPVTFDASASTLTNCATPQYRWFDAIGNPVRGWDPDPTLTVASIDCSQDGDWLVEVGCAGETCTRTATVTLTCVEVLANAGPDLTACDGVPFTITGASSVARGCRDVNYQWFDAGGAPVSGVQLNDPTITLTLNGCPGTATLALVAACADTGFETCGTFDTVDIRCGNPPVPVPTSTATCAGADVQCGLADPTLTSWWDGDTTVDADGDGDPANDATLAACDGALAYPGGGHPARAWSEDALGCRSFTDVAIDSLPGAPVPSPSAEPACPGMPSRLRCGSTEPVISWDFDVATDADGDTVPDDDAEDATCDPQRAYASGTHTARVTVSAVGGCASFADVTFTVAASVPPPEVPGDRVSHAGAALTMTWSSVAGAATYRVARGTIGTWYDHAADDSAGRGACDTAGAVTWTDPDDATDGSDWYYLVTAVEPCGAEGAPGSGMGGAGPFPRDARLPTASCP